MAARPAPAEEARLDARPEVTNVSRAFKASQIAARVFCGAQTPVSEPGFDSFPLIQPSISPVRRASTVPSAAPWLPT